MTSTKTRLTPPNPTVDYRSLSDQERCDLVVYRLGQVTHFLRNQDFFEEVRPGRWRKITGKTTGIEVETNYTRGEATIRLYVPNGRDPYNTVKLTGGEQDNHVRLLGHLDQ